MNTREKIIESTISLWSGPDMSGPSMRAILKKSGITAPSLYHRFDSLYHLYRESHEAALTLAERWLDARLEELDGETPLHPRAFAPLMAVLIHRWCHECRNLAFARFECVLETMRRDEATDIAFRWEILWRNFWQAVSERCGLADAGEATGALASGLSIAHLIPIRPTVDRCCIEEACRGWVDWCLGSRATENRWHEFALAAASSGNGPIKRPAGKALPLAEAAANLLVEKGTGEVTHRGVAAAAGVSTGAVAHYFRTVDDLLCGAFAAIYWRTMPSEQALAEAGGSTPPPAYSVRTLIDPPKRDWWPVIGWVEFHLALARDPALAALAPRIRYRGGHMSKRFLEAMLPPGSESGQTDRALFAHWVFGIRMQIAAGRSDPGFYRKSTAWFTETVSKLR